MWDHKDISVTKRPFKLVNQDTLEDAKGVTINLQPGVRRLLNQLHKRGIIISLASWNKPGPTLEALRLFGIHDFFKHPQVQYHPNKHIMIRKVIKNLQNEGIEIKPEEILYIDDRALHIKAIKKNIGPVKILILGQDIKTLDDTPAYLEKQLEGEF